MNKNEQLLDIFFSNKTADAELYYQLIGRGLVQAPKRFTVTPQPWDTTGEWILGVTEKPLYGNVHYAQIKVQLPVTKAPLTPISRVVVFARDQLGNINAESSAFYVDSLHQDVKLSLAHALDNQLNLEVEAPQGSLCAVDVSNDAHRQRLTQRRIMKLLETFDIAQDLMLKDRCELQRIANRQLNVKSPYQYRDIALNPFVPHVIDYHDAWDSFNDVGLIVSSDKVLDNSPCEWDEFPEGVPREVLAGMDAARPYLWHQLSAGESEVRTLAKLEKSLLEDLLYWNSHATANKKFTRKIAHTPRSIDKMVYGNAFCFNPEKGLRVASSMLEPEKRAYSLHPLQPERGVHGETFPVKLFVKKHVEGCVPVTEWLRENLRANCTSSF